MALSIYLNFNGNCREAFEFYRSVFGGEFDNIQTFGDGPGDFLVPADERDHVLHVSLPVGGSVLMGGDTPSWSPEPTEAGNNFAISYAPSTHEEADQLFARISDGGTVTMPLEDMFWGAYFGSCTDRFGINWQLNCEPE